MRSTQMRPLGQSMVNLSLLGFGAAPVGNLYRAMSDEQGEATVQEAVAAGIRYFDTAPHYGFGLSERRLGTALRDSGSSLCLSTKVGRRLVPTRSSDAVRYGFASAPPFEPVFDYSYDGVMRSFEASLQRLQTETVDLLLAHDLGELTHGAEHRVRFREFMNGGYRAMRDLRDAGLVRAIGLGANEWQVCETAMSHADLDGFLLAGRYTLLEQGACETFLPLCARRGISVVIGGPFNSGILASGVDGPAPHYYNYEPAPSAIIARVRELEDICRAFAIPLAAAALQFPAAHPQICSVIAGLSSPQEVRQAVTWMNHPIPDDFWFALRDAGLLHPAAPLPRSRPLSADLET